MIIVRSIGKHVLIAVTALFVLMVCCTGQAVAAEPWWHLSTISSPPAANSNEAKIDVIIANVGDARTIGTKREHLREALLNDETNGFVSITDKLPPGVTVNEVHQGGGGQSLVGVSGEEEFETELKGLEGLTGLKGPKLCSVSEETVECKYGQQVWPYEQIILELKVKVAPGAGHGVNQVSVSGGGAPPAGSRLALALEGAPSYGVQSYEVTPEEEGGLPNTQAGSHPYQLTTTLMFNTQAVRIPSFENEAAENFEYTKKYSPEVQPVALAKDLRFNLPPGLIGNPTPLPKCNVHVFLSFFSSGGKEFCPDNTVVGVATPITDSFHERGTSPLATSYPLYILEPSVGEPAKLGFYTAIGPVILDTYVRTGGDYGVVVSVSNITQAVAFIGNIVTLWGIPADPSHNSARNLQCLLSVEKSTEPGEEPEASCPVNEKPQPFVIMPTSCAGPLHTTVETDSWSDIGQFTEPFQYTFQNDTGEPIGTDGCNRLNFEPSIKVAPDGQQASTPTGLTVDVHVPQEASLNPTGLAEAAVKNTQVTLPAGVAINPAGADGLSACSQSEVALGSASEQSCPESSKIGTVEIKTPLLPNALTGAAYLAEQDTNPFGSLIAMYIVVYDPVSGVRVKVAGEVKPNPVTGQLVSTFDNTPEVPFEDLSLHFFGGSRAPLGTPALCGGYTTTASIAPWSGNAAVASSSEFDITSGPNGAPCSDPLPFDPSLTTGSLNIQAGAFTPFTMTMSREDGNQNLDAIQLKMPPGLLGTLSSIKLCGEAEGNAGTCGPESLIGETTVSVGLGGNPYTVKGGRVYITGPYEGAPYGLSIVNPAKAGPFNLGQVIVRAKIEVNPENAALTITSDTSGPYAIPQILDGIPLQIKHVNVSIDREDFTFNPTNCAPTEIGGSLTSSQGAVSVLHVPFQVTNCATLGFKPIFSVSTNGKTSRANGASLSVKLTYPKAAFGTQANIGKVKVDLPKQLPSRLTTLQKACPASVFEANPATCPPNSRIGSATATTPVLPVYLEGPAYFVSHGGAKFPELIIALSGEGVTVYLHGETFINKAGITSSTFRTIPDVPIGTFELKLPQGPDSALAANGNLCASKLVMPTSFVAANGMSIKQSTSITATGCPKKKTKKTKKAKKLNKSRPKQKGARK